MATRALVVGSGAVGLRTALELLHRNVSVVLKSSRHPLSLASCSVGAGGLWMPFKCNDARVDSWAMQTLEELYQEAAHSKSTVELVHAVKLFRQHAGPGVSDFVVGETPLPEWTKDHRLDFQHLTTEMLAWQNQVYKLRIPSQSQLTQLGYMHAWFFKTPIVNSPRMLEQMLKQVEQHEMTISADVNSGYEYASLEEMVNDAAQLGCDALVNCTGAASRTLCDDSNVIEGRGVILNFDRETCKRREFVHDETGEVMKNDCVIMSEESPWGTDMEPCYLIPRGNVLVVGGTCLEGDAAKGIRPEERKRLLHNAYQLGIDVKESEPIAEWVGFRPLRETLRCEIDESGVGQEHGVRVVHNYGHGGSGWTINVGTAKEVATLLLGDDE